jgi:hypothetical protein
MDLAGFNCKVDAPQDLLTSGCGVKPFDFQQLDLLLWTYKTDALPNAALEAHAKQLLCFNGELHGELLEHFLAEPIYDHGDGILSTQATLLQVEDLVLTNLRG